MFAGNQEIITLRQPGEAAAERVAASLREAGFSVMQSFDLQSNAGMNPACACGCQMRVLLVYGPDGPPATLLLDSSGPRRTTLSLVKQFGADDARPEWLVRLADLLAGLT